MRVSLCLILLFLAGCASQRIDQNIMFSGADPESLVVFGLDIRIPDKDPEFTFVQYDSKTGNVIEGSHITLKSMRNTITESLFASDIPAGHKYFIFEVPPGLWLMKQVRVGNVNIILSRGAISFAARQGVAHYLGEFVLRRNDFFTELRDLPKDLSGAQLELTHLFPGVKARLSEAEVTKIKFTCQKEFSLVQSCKNITLIF